MKLSEAIRLGAMLKPQAYGYILTPGGDMTCAWGSAYEAIGMRIRAGQYGRSSKAPAEWRKFASIVMVGPEGGKPRSIGSIIERLNDSGKWTRERIADWVESIENAQVTPEPALTPAIQRGGE